MATSARTTARRSHASIVVRGAGLLAVAVSLAACGDATPPEPSPAATDPAPTGPATVEILSPGTYRLDGEFVDGDALIAAFVAAGRGGTDPILDPLRIIVPASLEMGDAMPAIVAALQPPGRVNLTLRVIENGAGRETTLPVLSGCLCRAIFHYDGDVAPLDHDSSETYVIVEARIAGDGSITAFSTDVDRPTGPRDTPLPDQLAGGGPVAGEPLDLAALRAWFDVLEAADLQPLLCLDYRDTLPVSRLVDALIATRTALGPRVLPGPNPREPEREPEEEFQEPWDDE